MKTEKIKNKLKGWYRAAKDAERAEKMFFIALALFLLFAVVAFIQIMVTMAQNDCYLYASDLFNQNRDDVYMDFYNVIRYAVTWAPYDVTAYANQPPLVYVLAVCFAFGNASDAHAYADSPAGIAAFVIYLLLFFVPAFFMIRTATKRCGAGWGITATVYAGFVFSHAVLFSVQRGNHILFSALFAAYFLLWYRSEKRWRRETAYVALALSIATKIVPIAFAFLLLNKKYWKNLLQTALYTAVLVFVPFFFFKGGFVHNLTKYFDNISYFNSTALTGEGITFGLSFPSFVSAVYLKATGTMVADLPAWIASASSVLSYIFVALAVVMFFLLRTYWKKVTALVLGFCVLYSSPSYAYYLLFMLIAFALFLGDRNKTPIDYIYLALFLVMLLPLPFGYMIQKEECGLLRGYQVISLLQSLAVFLMFFILLGNSCYDAVQCFRNRNQSRQDAEKNMRQDEAAVT